MQKSAIGACLNSGLKQQDRGRPGTERRIVPARRDHMGRGVVGFERSFGRPFLDQHETVRVAGDGVQVILNTALLGPDQRRQLRERCQLVRPAARLGLDNHDKPYFI